MLLRLLSLVFASVCARVSNVTIDDTLGDELTGKIPQHAPEGWIPRSTSGAPCVLCTAQPDATHIYKGTWHDKSTFIQEPTPSTISMSFNGTRIYVYFILFNNIGTVNNNTRLRFYLDGSSDPTRDFLHLGSPAGERYLYNQLVYNSRTLEHANHTLLISSYSTALLHCSIARSISQERTTILLREARRQAAPRHRRVPLFLPLRARMGTGATRGTLESSLAPPLPEHSSSCSPPDAWSASSGDVHVSDVVVGKRTSSRSTLMCARRARRSAPTGRSRHPRRYQACIRRRTTLLCCAVSSGGCARSSSASDGSQSRPSTPTSPTALDRLATVLLLGGCGVRTYDVGYAIANDVSGGRRIQGRKTRTGSHDLKNPVPASVYFARNSRGQRPPRRSYL